jgi:hypothetical protein
MIVSQMLFNDTGPWIERLLDQGNNHILSKFWVPLEEFIREAMDGLKRGDGVIVPRLQEVYDKFEREKMETITQRAGQLRIAFPGINF